MHQAREKLGLSLNEYALADIIYQLQNNPTSDHMGWCYASKKTLGNCVGLSERAVYKTLNRLEKEGLIEKQEKTKHLRATSRWYEYIVSMKKQLTAESAHTMHKVQSNYAQNAVEDTAQSSYNNNKIDNYINKDNTCNKVNSLISMFKTINPSYKTLFSNRTQREALERLVGEHTEAKVVDLINSLPDIIYKPYAPKITTPLQLERKLGELQIFISQEKGKKRGGVGYARV